MKKNHSIILILLLICTNAISQKNRAYTFGKITKEEYDLKVYKKDSTANAVFLFESGETFFKLKEDNILVNSTYYAKVKIFDRSGFGNATIEIPIYNNKKVSEKVIKIKAFTHNGNKITPLNKQNIFTEKVDKNWSIVKFTMPNVIENSIIEYEYTFQTPFKSNFTGWGFQTDIPKIHSRFHALIPSNYVYSRSLIGILKLTKNEASIKKDCFHLPRYTDIQTGDCEELLYTMDDVPAFIEEEFMTAKKNHLSRIEFKISEFRGFYGSKQNFTENWKDIDEAYKNEKSLGKQLLQVNYMRKQLPSYLFEIKAPLEKAIKAFDFIKNHYTWNKKIKLFYNINVKKAFKDKNGSFTEINFALINALKALNMNADFLLLSTRANGLPSKSHPTIRDFNYGAVRTVIEGKEYFLDASDKLLSFGMLPYKSLNSYGRIIDLKKGSYWTTIVPNKNSQERLTLNLKINDNGDFEGVMFRRYNGYRAFHKRKKIKLISQEKYLETIENGDNHLIINSYKNSNLDSVNQPFKEFFDIIIENENEFSQNTVILNLFINSKLKKNPFQLNERTYPVDFGYPRSFIYILTLVIPDGYRINALPKNRAFRLPNGGGSFLFSLEVKENKIKMISRFKINKSYFNPSEYSSLKKFYAQVIDTQNSLITLSKKQ